MVETTFTFALCALLFFNLGSAVQADEHFAASINSTEMTPGSQHAIGVPSSSPDHVIPTASALNDLNSNNTTAGGETPSLTTETKNNTDTNIVSSSLAEKTMQLTDKMTTQPSSLPHVNTSHIPLTHLVNTTSVDTTLINTLPTSSIPKQLTQSQTHFPTTTTTTISTQSTSTSSTSLPPTSSAEAKPQTNIPSQRNVGGDTTMVRESPKLDPLLAGLVSAFIITAVIITLLLFLKLRRRDRRPEFRRLQELPMDDMEDTPLSMYTY